MAPDIKISRRPLDLAFLLGIEKSCRLVFPRQLPTGDRGTRLFPENSIDAARIEPKVNQPPLHVGAVIRGQAKPCLNADQFLTPRRIRLT